jgi:cytidine deaminase
VSPRAERAAVTATEDHELRSLKERALAAMHRAYAPYSKFQVGAALLGSDGSVVEGCNVENASFPAGTCAERVALGAAVTRGVRSFRMVVIASSGDAPASPCGMCRQALNEFSPELEVVSITRSGTEARWRLSDLLPHAFSPAALDSTRD